MTNEPIRIFYSWQSWTPSARNREFIEECLNSVREQIEVEPDQTIVIDRDTKDLPGAPAIADAILRKIEQCHVFVADVTFVIKDDEHKSPNPNVILELGYAVKSLGWERVVLVMNTALGLPKDLPFDLVHRRWPLTYKLESGDQKTKERDQLIGGLKVALQTILNTEPFPTSESVTDTIERLLERGEDISLDRLMRVQIANVNQKTSSNDFFQERELLIASAQQNDDEFWSVGFDFHYREIQTELDSLLSLCWYGRSSHTQYINAAVKLWMQEKKNDPQPAIPWHYLPSLFLIYVTGIAAIAQQKWDYLKVALLNQRMPHPRQPEIKVSAFDLISEKFTYYYLQNHEPYISRSRVPIGMLLEKSLSPLFKRLLLSESDFVVAFDTFEFIASLHHFHVRMDSKLGNPLLPRSGEYNRYNARSFDEITLLLSEGRQQGDSWPLLKAGLFNSSSSRMGLVLTKYQERLELAADAFQRSYGVENYLEAYQPQTDIN